jgi:hypothetical protein
VIGPSDLIYGVLLPALIAGVILMLVGRGTPLEAHARPFLGALAIGLGYLVAQVMLVGFPRPPFTEAEVPARDWVAWLVVGAIVLAPVRLSPALARWSGPLYMALFSLLVFKLVLGRALPPDAGGMILRLGLTFAMYIVWNVVERVALRSTGAAVPVGLVVAGSGIAICALASHVAVFAQLTGAVCAGLGAAAVLGWIDKGFRLPVGAVAVAMIVFAGALVNTSVYDLPRASAALLVVAILAPGVTEIGKLHDLSPAKRGLLALVAAAVPAAVAILIAQSASSDA